MSHPAAPIEAELLLAELVQGRSAAGEAQPGRLPSKYPGPGSSPPNPDASIAGCQPVSNRQPVSTRSYNHFVDACGPGADGVLESKDEVIFVADLFTDVLLYDMDGSVAGTTQVLAM